FYNMVDSIVVGKYVNSRALAAVGSVGSINFLFFSLCFGLAAGIGILISQYFGAGKKEMVKKIVANSIYITLISGAIMSVVGVFLSKPILILMNSPKETFAYSHTYMVIVNSAILLVAAYNMVSSILRALGDSRTPLIFLVVSCLLNIVLDLLFVVVFKLGVTGVALATVISQVIAMIGSIIYGYKKNEYLRIEKKHMKFDSDIFKKSFKIGIPLAAQNSLIAFSCMALQSVVNHYGATVMAAYTATSRVEQLVQQPFGALGTAVSTFAGQNAGAGKMDRVKSGCKKGLLLVCAFSMLMLSIMFIFGESIIGIFVNESDVIKMGATGLRITSLMYIPLGTIYTMRGMLNGVGDTTFTMMNGVAEVVGRVGFALLFMMIPAIGVWGIWYTNGLTWILTALMNTFRFVQGRWKKKSLVRRPSMT
nr:MATE family efflux transporter [Lachnospiraceae bacterium]